jgi:predicted  nucleic acid-binding Zn-ribbon protein
MATIPNPLNNESHAGTSEHRKIICEFCECRLAPSGEVLQLGEKAKKFRDHSDEMEKANRRIRELEGTIQMLNQKITELTPKESGTSGNESETHRTLRRM